MYALRAPALEGRGSGRLHRRQLLVGFPFHRRCVRVLRFNPMRWTPVSPLPRSRRPSSSPRKETGAIYPTKSAMPKPTVALRTASMTLNGKLGISRSRKYQTSHRQNQAAPNHEGTKHLQDDQTISPCSPIRHCFPLDCPPPVAQLRAAAICHRFEVALRLPGLASSAVAGTAAVWCVRDG
jgi:hypothetical protein